MTVKMVKFTSGEEVITEVVNTLEDSIIIKNALRFLPTNQGFMPVEFPLMAMPEEEIKINNSFVMFVCEVADKAIDAYHQYFSDIIQPNKNSLIV